MRRSVPVVTAFAVVGLSIAAFTMPSDAEPGDPGVEVTGEAECNVPSGGEGWTIQWTITNVTEVPSVSTPATLVGEPEPYSVAILFPMVHAGAWTEPLPVVPGFQLLAGASIVVPGPVPTEVVGDVTAEVPWSTETVQGVASATVTIDGSCVSATSSPPPPGVAAEVTAQPAFTG